MDEASIRRVQPNDAMAEQAVVGAMIKDNEMIPVASEIVSSSGRSIVFEENLTGLSKR